MSSTPPLSPKNSVNKSAVEKKTSAETTTDQKIRSQAGKISSVDKTEPMESPIIHAAETSLLSAVVEAVKTSVDKITVLCIKKTQLEEEVSSDEEKKEDPNYFLKENEQLRIVCDEREKSLATAEKDLIAEENSLVDMIKTFLGFELKFDRFSLSSGRFREDEIQTSNLNDLSKEEEMPQIKQINFLGKRLKNNLINRIVYLEKTRSLLNQHVDVILREFFSGSEISPNNVICLVHPAGEETHNKGQITVRVTLKEIGQNKEIEKAIFYKPRSALTEKAIIDLFIDLNKVKSEDTPDLPFYKIYSLGENGSLWESIEGNNDIGVSAFEHLQMMEKSKEVSTEVLEKARKNLFRLETVCRKIGLCDLHYQNIFLKKEVEWIPIDMEVIMFGRATGVFGPENPPLVMLLSAEEERLIDQFNKGQFGRFSRVVPVRTAPLITAGLSYNGAVGVAMLLEDNLKREFSHIQLAELERLAKEDVDNGDISILYLKEGNLYYGTYRKIIGVLKQKEFV